jgi:hypothetical protein
MNDDDLKLKMLLVQIELAELRQIIQAKEDTFKALEWHYHDRTEINKHENAIKVHEKTTWVFNPNIGTETLMTDGELANAEKNYDEFLKSNTEPEVKDKEIILLDDITHDDYIESVEQEEYAEMLPDVMPEEECKIEEALYDEYLENQKQEDIKSASEEKEIVDLANDVAELIEQFGIEPLSVDALSIMAIKYYKKTGEAVTDIIEERFNVKSLHKLTDIQNCVLQLILRG